MTSFTDTEGRSWTVQVTVDSIRRVRDLTGVNLAVEATGGDLFERLAADPVLLCDILYGLVKPEADARGVSDADFGRALAGDVLEGATAALLEGLVGFFPSGRRRLLAKAVEKMRVLETRALEAAEARLESPELAQEMETALRTLGGSVTASPGSSASTQAP